MSKTWLSCMDILWRSALGNQTGCCGWRQFLPDIFYLVAKKIIILVLLGALIITCRVHELITSIEPRYHLLHVVKQINSASAEIIGYTRCRISFVLAVAAAFSLYFHLHITIGVAAPSTNTYATVIPLSIFAELLSTLLNREPILLFRNKLRLSHFVAIKEVKPLFTLCFYRPPFCLSLTAPWLLRLRAILSLLLPIVFPLDRK